MTSYPKDAIYSQPQQKVADFQFDESVAEVFPDMIQRSIPGYSTIVDNIGQIAKNLVKQSGNIYDLGCSLGAVSLSIRRYLNDENSKIIAVDNSEAMVERCKLHLQAFKSNTPYEVLCEDIQKIEIQNASLVVMNFTLQFIPPELRHALIEKIYAGLQKGGAFIISEKYRHEEVSANGLMVDLHHEFKRRNGYSELEISQKRTALENVMLIESLEEHKTRLEGIGFTSPTVWFNCFNFASMLAIKE